MSYRGRSDYDDRDYYPERRRSPSRRGREAVDELDVRVRERSVSRTPAFLRDDAARRAADDRGALVLRQREVEEIERGSRPARGPARRRSPSPSPVRVVRERVIARPRSLSPRYREHDVERERIRTVERERERVRSPSRPQVERVRIVERERERQRSPSPVREVRARIVERRRSPSPSPSPSPPRVIKGPTIEREVITHYRDIDHGVVRAHPPTPPPAPARHTHKDTEIDIYTSKHRTEVDIDIHRSESRARSRERRSSRHYHDELVHDHRHAQHDLLRIEDRRAGAGGRRRAHSAAPLSSPVHEEAEYITSRIDARGRMGEAHHGATRDWTIIDVPPGTERVRMDGVGGGGAEVTWQRYNGVRRSKFVPDRDDDGGGALVATGRSSSTTIVSESGARDRDRDRDRDRERLSVQVYDRDREIDIEKVSERRVVRPPPRRPEMWTEITKDLVLREAIEELGYEYEETEWFFYIMKYLRYDDVQQLVQLSDDIRRHRRERARDREWEREWREDWERRHHHHHHHHHDYYDDERIREREVIIDTGRSPRAYIR